MKVEIAIIHRSNFNLKTRQNPEEKKNFDNDTEQEAIMVIKTQSKKIKELTEELEKKDDVIITLQSKMNNMDNYKLQMENFKRQVSILEEKLKLYDSEVNNKTNYFSEQFKTISESENKLRNQIISKDKLLRDYDLIIKDQEKSINQLKKQLVDKESSNKELKQEFNEISARFKNLTMKMSLREEEYKKIQIDYENKFSIMEEDKYKTEEKVNELIDIVKQQSKELSDFSVQIQINEKEKKLLQKNIEKMKGDQEELYKANFDLKQQLNIISELKKRINETDQVTLNLEKELEAERMANHNLSKGNSDMNEKLQFMKSKLTGENSPEYLSNVIENKNIEIVNLMQTIDHAKKVNSNLELSLKEKENETKEIINGINVEIKTINQWIDTYLGVYFDQYIEIPELPYTVSKVIKNKIKFDSLKDNLVKSQKKMNDELSKCNSIVRELKGDAEDQITSYERIINENSELKSDILKKNEEIYFLQQEIETCNSEIGITKEALSKQKFELTERNDSFINYCESINSKIKEEIDLIRQNSFILNNFSEFLYRATYSENVKDQIKDGIDIIFNIFNNVVSEYENLYNKELNQRTNQKCAEGQMKMNNMKVNNQSLSHQLNEKDELITEMNNEIQNLKNTAVSLKNTIKLQDKNVGNDENVEKLKIYEKKINNLNRELELKDIQIKSQEQMISRRNKELEELRDDKKGKSFHTQHSQMTEDKLNKSLNSSKNNINISHQELLKSKMNYNYKINEVDEDKNKFNQFKQSGISSRNEDFN